MIGTVIIASVGYGASIFTAALAVRCIWIGATCAHTARRIQARKDWFGPTLFSLLMAVITRWLVGGVL